MIARDDGVFPGSATIDYSGLVLHEMQQTVAELKSELGKFLNTGSSHSQQTAYRLCRQIINTLELLDKRGARLIAEEVQLLLRSRLFQVDDALSGLADSTFDSQGFEQIEHAETRHSDTEQRRLHESHVMLLLGCERLAEYLEYLRAGGADQIPALLPLVNNLRACRGSHLLSENLLAGSAFNLPGSNDTAVTEEAARDRFFDTVRQCRHPFMLAVLEWYQSGSEEHASLSQQLVLKDKRKKDSLKTRTKKKKNKAGTTGEVDAREELLALLHRLEQDSPTLALQDFWRAAQAVCISVLDGSLEFGPAIRQLLGQIERYLKELLDYQQARNQLRLPRALYKNLLYYVGLSTSADSRVQELAKRIGLQSLLPESDASAVLVEQFRDTRFNADLAVVDSLVLEVDSIRDFVGNYAETGLPESDEIASNAVRLEQVAATFMLLGDKDAEECAQEAARILADAANSPDPARLQMLATHLIELSETLEEMQHSGASSQLFIGGFDRDVLKRRHLSAHKLDKIVRQCMQEARDVIDATETTYVEALELSRELMDTGSDVSAASQQRRQTVVANLQKNAEALEGTRQALMILPLPELTPMLAASAGYLRWYSDQKLNSGVPNALSREFADLLVNTSAYLDDNVQAQSGASDLLQNAEHAMQRVQHAMTLSSADLSLEFTSQAGQVASQHPGWQQSDAGELSSRVASPDHADQLNSDNEFEQHTLAVDSATQSVAGMEIVDATRNDLTEQTLALDTPQQIDASHAPEPVQGQFIDEALQRFEQIGRSLNEWQSRSSTDALYRMQAEYQALAQQGELIGDDTTELVEFARANESMLIHVNAGSQQPSVEVEGLMQESVAVLPQLLNQLPTTLPRRPSSKPASSAVRRNPDEVVSGLSGLLQRLREVSESSNLNEADSTLEAIPAFTGLTTAPTPAASTTVSATNAAAGIAANPHNPENTDDDFDTTQALPPAQTAITENEDIAQVSDTTGTWASAASPKTNALASRPRINTPLRTQGGVTATDNTSDELSLAPDQFDSTHVVGDAPGSEESCSTEQTRVEKTVADDFSVATDAGTLRVSDYALQHSVSANDERDDAHRLELSDAGFAANGDAVVPAPTALSALGTESNEGFSDTLAIDSDVGDDSYSSGLPDLDTTLFSVFEAECSGHLATLRGVTSTVLSSRAAVPVADRFIQALHTLHGSALAAGETGIVSIAEPFEQLAVHYHRNSESPDFKQWNEFAESVETLSTALDVRAAGGDTQDITEPAAVQLKSSLQMLKQGGIVTQQPDHHSALAERPNADKSLEQDTTNTGFTFQPIAVEANALQSGAGSRQQQLFDIFLEEAAELLAKMQFAHDELLPIQDDSAPLSLQRKETNLRDVLRQLHTLKGSARVAGSEAVAGLAHHVESVLMAWHQAGKAGERFIDRKRVDLLQASVDALVINIDQAREGGEPGDFDMLVSELNQDLDTVEQHPAEHNSQSDSTDLDATLELSSDDLTAGTAGLEATVLNSIINYEQAGTGQEFRQQAAEQSLATVSDTKPQPAAPGTVGKTQASPETKSEALAETEDKAAGGTVHLDGAVVQRLSNLSTEVSVHHARLNQGLGSLQEVLVDLDRTTGSLRHKLRELEYESAVIPDTALPTANDDSDLSNLLNQDSADSDGHGITNMDATIGLSEAASTALSLHSEEDSRQLTEILHDLDTIRSALHERLRTEEETLAAASRLGNDIHESLVQAKLVRFDNLQSRLESTVRQSSRALERPARLRINGGAIAIDRDVHRRLAAPLEHLLRNAVAHGIEDSQVRLQRNKPAIGEIVVSAQIEGSDLVVDVIDDGGGIDVEKVRKLSGLANATDRQVLQQLLRGGISTRNTVDMVSGRGIGLESIVQLLGEINAEVDVVSTDTAGTRMRMRIPQNVLINHAVVADFDGCLLGIPANFVRRVVSINDDTSGPGTDVSLLDVADLLGLQRHSATDFPSSASDLLDSEDTDSQRIVIFAEGREMYLQPRRVLGFRDLVTRPLGVQLASLGVYTGASLQSDGSQIMVLDATRLMRRHAEQLATGAHSMGTAEAETAITTNELYGRAGADATSSIDTTADLTTSQVRRIVDQIDFGSTVSDSSVTAGGSSYPQRNILVVDDSITLRTYTCGIVQNNGLTTIEARDGYEALEALKRMPEAPAAMVVDIEMPRMDGFALVDSLRKIRRLEKLPVIMISSRSGTYNRLRARELGVAGFLGKPYREKDLQRLLAKLRLVDLDTID